MRKRKLASLFLAAITLFTFTGCGNESVASVEEENEGILLRLSHGQTADSDVAQITAQLKTALEEDSEMNIAMEIFDSGVLGTEREMIELVKAGVLDMARVSASSLDAFNEYFSIFTLPYVFEGYEHYHNAMANSEAIQEIFKSSEEDGFIAIGYHASGARNIYLTEDIPVTDPSVLNRKKIRVMESPTAIEMIRLMGGTAVPMGTSEVYTALQQGVIDGAENTEMALSVNKHGEVVSSYTYTEHQFLPDIFIISTNTWNKLSTAQQEFLVETLQGNAEKYIVMYEDMINDAKEIAERMGVTFYEIDKTPFIEAVQPMHDALKSRGENFARFYEDIQSFK